MELLKGASAAAQDDDAKDAPALTGGINTDERESRKRRGIVTDSRTLEVQMSSGGCDRTRTLDMDLHRLVVAQNPLKTLRSLSIWQKLHRPVI
jgi:hypothetical protein